MGLFSKKKKVYVSSSLWNLAGDINKRTQFLPTTIATKVMSGSEESMSEAITKSLLNGNGIKFRSYARWARTKGYDRFLGLSVSTIYVGDNIDHEVLRLKHPAGPNQAVLIQTAEIGVADYGFWVDKWMLENHPDEVTASYEIDFDELINTVYITFPDGKVYTMQPEGFDANGVYLYYSYVTTTSNEQKDVVEGAEIIVNSKDDWPSITGWKLVSNTLTPKTVTLTDTRTTEITYSDDTPSEKTVETAYREFTGNEQEIIHTRDFYQGLSLTGSSTSTITRWIHRYTRGRIVNDTPKVTTTTETLPDGVVKTTKVTVVRQVVEPVYSYREDEQTTINSATSSMSVVIYKRGSGLDPQLEVMFDTPMDVGTFLPFVPVRVWNNTIKSGGPGSTYDWNKKAIKKAMDKKYDFLVKQLESTGSIGEIDFAYCVFGVSLNTKENVGRKYIMLFFQYLNTIGGGAAGRDTAWIAWEKAWLEADRIQQHWLKWRDAQSNPLDPLYNTPEPPRATYPAQPYRTVRMYSQNVNFNMSLSYGGIKVQRVTGQYQDLRMGKTRFRLGDPAGTQEYQELLASAGLTDTRALNRDTLLMYWQDKPDSFLSITVSGIWHNYIIYKGKGVDIHTASAMSDPDESGCLIPLHEEIFRKMSLPDATQLATSCAYMVCNSYKVVKKKWYQSSWFKVVLVVAAIVITVVTLGSGAPAGAGLLGAAGAVGASIGLAGTAALLAGAALNAIAGFIVAQIIMAASVAIFGPEIGAIIGAIAGVAAVSIGTSVMGGGTMIQGLQNIASAPNLLKMVSSVGQGFAAAMDQKMGDLKKDMAQLQQEYTEKMGQIMDAWTANLGAENGKIDVTQLTQAARERYYYENLNDFLSRTLMTGSDIANTTNGLIGSFASATITPQLT